MNRENVSHENSVDAAADTAQAEPCDLAAGPEVVFVEVRRVEPPLRELALLAGAGFAVGIALGRFLERLEI